MIPRVAFDRREAFEQPPAELKVGAVASAEGEGFPERTAASLVFGPLLGKSQRAETQLTRTSGVAKAASAAAPRPSVRAAHRRPD
jgi:hypothetical protein